MRIGYSRVHELKNRAAYASVRFLRSVFTDYKHTRECWNVGDNKRYAALVVRVAIICNLSAITGKLKNSKKSLYFDDTDNGDFHPFRDKDERTVYDGDDGCDDTG